MPPDCLYNRPVNRGRKIDSCQGVILSDFEAPSGLQSAGLQAFWRAIEALGGSAAAYLDDATSYAWSIDRLDVLRSAWINAGRPVDQLGGSTGSILVPHHLIGDVAKAEIHAAKMAERIVGLTVPKVGGKSTGRERGQVSEPDRAAAQRRRRLAIAKPADPK